MHANGSRGDTANDGFAFASFFPNVIQPPVKVFGNAIFTVLGKSLIKQNKRFTETNTTKIFVYVISFAINSCFSETVRLKVCRRPIRRYDVSGGGLSGGAHSGAGSGSISISLPGVENQDTERRRQIALKALSDRLSKSEGSSLSTSIQQSWPSLSGIFFCNILIFLKKLQ